ncbi:hypothetical protein [Leptospira ilyithenensis]|uniref:Uncharacterized protein n=1 Tax=Leptospira ilyithenensis TaxID=2484901 RepID=A0A4R9LMI2_9LEPT|nr:hypothetical protein [Leptospira ilyithenensis]TGN09771.1 hypothetical protein EHS11_11860 [Leptospira ilyithenensis]
MSTAQLHILEGDHGKDGLSLLKQEKSHFLFGDSTIGKQYKVSLNGDHIVGYDYSPLYERYTPSNLGTEEAVESFQDSKGVIWHVGKKGNLLGCSVCIEDGTLGNTSPQTIIHYNLDGTLAGISHPTAQNNYVLLEGAHELGISLKVGGLKLPKLSMPKLSMPKISLPKISIPKISIPKINIPKFKIPKINIPKINIPKIDIPKIKVPDIGNMVSNIGQQISQGVSNVGQQISQGAQQFTNEALTKPLEAVGQAASGLVSTATSLVSNILNPNAGMATGQEAGAEEQPQDYTQPGYEDQQGYTASDGMYYLNDGSGFLDPQSGQWYAMDGSPYGGQTGSTQPSSYLEPGYQDANGYTANDGIYYLIDGSGYLDPTTNQYYSMDGSPYGSNSNLGFDISSLLSIAGPALSTVIPGAGLALPLVSQFLPGASGTTASRPQTTVRPAPTPPRVTSTASRPVVTPPPPPRAIQTPVANRSTQTPITNSVTSQQQAQPKDNTKTYIMIGGAVVVLGGAILFLKQGRRR